MKMDRAKLVARRERNARMGRALFAVLVISAVGGIVAVYKPIITGNSLENTRLAICRQTPDTAPAGYEVGSSTPVCSSEHMEKISGENGWELQEVPQGWEIQNHYRSKSTGEWVPFGRPCSTVNRMIWVKSGTKFGNEPVPGRCPRCGNRVVAYPPGETPEVTPDLPRDPIIERVPPHFDPPPKTGKYNNDPVRGDSNGDVRNEQGTPGDTTPEDGGNPTTTSDPNACDSSNPGNCSDNEGTGGSTPPPSNSPPPSGGGSEDDPDGGSTTNPPPSSPPDDGGTGPTEPPPPEPS